MPARPSLDGKAPASRASAEHGAGSREAPSALDKGTCQPAPLRRLIKTANMGEVRLIGAEKLIHSDRVSSPVTA